MADQTADEWSSPAEGDGSGAFSWLPSSVLGATLDVVGDGIVVVDSGGTVLAANDAFARLCGHEAWEIEGASAAVFTVDGTDDFVGRACRVLRNAASWGGRVKLRRRDGSVIECDAWVSRVEVDEGGVFIAAHREVEVQRRYGDTYVDEVEAKIHALVNSLASLRGYVALLDSLPVSEHAEIRSRLSDLTGTTSDRLELLLTELRRH